MTSCWKHVPGKGLLSPWLAACAPFAYTSTVGLYQGQDIGVSGPLIWSGKAVFTFFMVEGIGTARNSYPTPFCKEVSNIHVDFLKSMAVVVDCLSLCWKTYLIPFQGKAYSQLRVCSHSNKLRCNKCKLPDKIYKTLGEKKSTRKREDQAKNKICILCKQLYRGYSQGKYNRIVKNGKDHWDQLIQSSTHHHHAH